MSIELKTWNLIAYDFVGLTDPTQYIPAGNFTINATNDALGISLVNNSMINITEATLGRDVGGIDANRNLYFCVSMPLVNLLPQIYTSSSAWNLMAMT